MKSALYETLMSRDWYREVTFEDGMHKDLILQFIRTLALLIQPITPHSAEHIWKAILKEQTSIQTALWPEPPATYQPRPDLIDASTYMKGTLKAMRDAELLLVKKKAKKGAAAGAYDPSLTKAVKIFVADSFPPWQDQSVEVIQKAYNWKTGVVDDALVKEELTKSGLLKDKRIMPFIQVLKVRFDLFSRIELLSNLHP